MASNKNSEITFETAVTRLEQLTGQLENGSLTLDESVRIFEEGIRLSKFCESKLRNIEQRITVIENSDYTDPESEQTPSSNTENGKKSKKSVQDDNDNVTLF